MVEIEREVIAKCTRSESKPVYETLLLKHWQFEEARSRGMASSLLSAASSKVLADSDEVSSLPAPLSVEGSKSTFMSSALSSQVMLIPEEAQLPAALFPTGIKDINSQQVDLRRHNSWLLTLEDVSTPELAEVMAINAMAPCILAAKLKPLLMAQRPVAGMLLRYMRTYI